VKYSVDRRRGSATARTRQFQREIFRDGRDRTHGRRTGDQPYSAAESNKVNLSVWEGLNKELARMSAIGIQPS
jgi:hypothetical protein